MASTKKDKNGSKKNINNTLSSDQQKFMKWKRNENERLRLKALQAMILDEQRKRGDPDETIEAMINMGAEYTEDGKLKFTYQEQRLVQRLRKKKIARIEAYLREQYISQEWGYDLRM